MGSKPAARGREVRVGATRAVVAGRAARRTAIVVGGLLDAANVPRDDGVVGRDDRAVAKRAVRAQHEAGHARLQRLDPLVVAVAADVLVVARVRHARLAVQRGEHLGVDILLLVVDVADALELRLHRRAIAIGRRRIGELDVERHAGSDARRHLDLDDARVAEVDVDHHALAGAVRAHDFDDSHFAPIVDAAAKLATRPWPHATCDRGTSSDPWKTPQNASEEQWKSSTHT